MIIVRDGAAIGAANPSVCIITSDPKVVTPRIYVFAASIQGVQGAGIHLTLMSLLEVIVNDQLLVLLHGFYLVLLPLGEGPLGRLAENISLANPLVSLLLLLVVIIEHPSSSYLIPGGVGCLRVVANDLPPLNASEGATTIPHCPQGPVNDLRVGSSAAALVDPSLGGANFLTVAVAIAHVAASACQGVQII